MTIAQGPGRDQGGPTPPRDGAPGAVLSIEAIPAGRSALWKGFVVSYAGADGPVLERLTPAEAVERGLLPEHFRGAARRGV